MEQLGIEPSLLLAQIVNFTIIIVVLSKLLYKPILNLLEKRRKEIADGLALTEKMRVEEEKLKEKHQKLNEKARQDARRVIEEARKEALEEQKRIIADTHSQAAEIMEKAKLESSRQYEEMVKKVKKEAVELAVAMSKRLTSNILSDKEQRRLISQNLKDLESIKLK